MERKTLGNDIGRSCLFVDAAAGSGRTNSSAGLVSDLNGLSLLKPCDDE